MEVLKLLIENKRVDELLKVFSKLEGESKCLKIISIIFFVDVDIVRFAHVRKEWRQFINSSGAIKKYFRQLEKPAFAEKSLEAVEKTFDECDDIFRYCFMKSFDSGIVYGWGSNQFGQLDVDLNHARDLPPREITMLGSVERIFAGSFASFAIKDAKLYAFGDNRYGQLGLGDEAPDVIEIPEEVSLPSVKSLAVSPFSGLSSTVFAVDTAGRLWTWGDQIKGARIVSARNYTREYTTPKLVDGLENYQVKQVAVGDGVACCLTTDGEVFTWGQKNFIGQGDIDSHIEVPKKLDIGKICQISCSGTSTLLLSEDKKSVWGFGSNYSATLGFPQELVIVPKPAQIPFTGGRNIRKIQCAGSCSAILYVSGYVALRGYFPGNNYQDEDDQWFPRGFIMKDRAVDISMNKNLLLILTVNNRLYAVGVNGQGQCGQGTTSNLMADPVDVKLPDNVRIKQISTGTNHCLIKCSKI